MSLDLLPPAAIPPKTQGLRHVFAAAGYSAAGFRWMLREAAFRHELLAGGVTLIAFALVRVPLVHALAQIGLLLMLLALEAVNTAIERIVDRLSPDFSLFAKEAKDLGSFAVFCLLAINALSATVFLYGAILGG